MDQKHHVALLGATGKAGKYILQALLNRGYAVKALIRKPNNFTITHPLLQIVPGDIKDLETARTLAKGCDVVISAIGPRKDEPLISSLSTINVLTAMNEFGIKRYISLAGLNLNIPGDNKSEANKAKSDWMCQNFPEAVADRQKAYDILVESDIDWTILRLPWIEQTDERRGVFVDLYDCPGEKISTTDLADFAIEQIKGIIYLRRAPFVAGSNVLSRDTKFCVSTIFYINAFRSNHDCSSIVAEILSTNPLFCLAFLLMPLCNITAEAILEVKRSSIISMGISGKVFFSRFTKPLTCGADCEGVLSICFGSPTTKRSTCSVSKYFFR